MWTSVDIVDSVNVNMFFERVDLVEGHVAYGTIVGAHLCRVHLDVACQGRVAEEPLATLLTGEGLTLIRTMYCHMFLK
jgi:hypothetical protein